jgi:hypothetical protein
MRKLISFVAFVVFFTFTQMSMAYIVSTPTGGYGMWQTERGGEFTLTPTDGLGWVLNSYNGVAKDQGGVTNSFQTFCLETAEYIYPGTSYSAALSQAAVYNNINSNSDPISIGTAKLYYLFATGAFNGVGVPTYDYSNTINGGSRKADADLLQKTIWWLEGEAVDPGDNNKFKTYIKGAYAAPMADNAGAINVVALNLWANGHLGDFDYRAQDMLVVVPIPATVWLLGAGLVALIGIQRRKMI